MDLELRPVQGDEIDDFQLVDGVAFGARPRPDQLQRGRLLLEPARTMAAFGDGRIVGTSATLTSEVTVPGPVTLPLAAVTYVGVLPTHRRRGVLTAMMTALLDEARSREEPLAGLLASESAIYGRFGFGPATSGTTYEVDRRDAVPLRGWPEAPGRLEMLDADEAREVLPEAFDGYRRARPGEVARSAGWWAGFFADPEEDRERLGGPRFVVVHRPPGGGCDGYVSYRVEQHWETGVAEHVLHVAELVALDPGVRMALWRFCFDVDLVARVVADYFPVDEPLRWALADPRRLRAPFHNDVLWVRVLDVARALAARRYAVDDRLVLELSDPFVPGNSGRYELVAGAGGAECRRTDADPDLVLGAADLGAVYLGATGFWPLAAVGRVREETPGALRRASTLFVTDPAPHCSTDF